MSHADFIHLRNHSAYSLSQGALRLKELVKLCEKHRMPAVAVTDSGNLFGVLEFAGAAKDAGVQPIVGCLLPVTRMDQASGPGALTPPPDLLPLLAQDQQGYLNLLKLVSMAYLESDPQLPPQVSLAQVAERAQGILALTGGPPGALNRLLAEGQRPAAEAWLARLQEVFPGRLYVELQRHGLPKETAVEPALLDLAYARELPLVATNDCHFATADLYEAHDALLCIAHGTTMGDGERPRLTPHHRFKTAAEMRALFADLPEACDNTLVIARRCAFFPEKVKPILPAYPTAAGRGEPDELRAMSEKGLELRLENEVYKPGQSESEREAAAKPYRERLAFELDVIIQMGFPGYFLIVADFIQWAKAQGIPVGPGRGSGAGSVVAWALTITDLDPLRWGLLFERFLNPERVSMPDFDIDFCQDRRDEVICYVQRKYGRDRVAQIITFGKLQARAALRDVGRVLQMPYGYIDKICKLVPMNPANPVTLQQAIDGEPQLQAFRETDPDVARLMDIALKLEGLYRHASTHAAGVVIGNRPLEELIPLYRDPRSDMPVTQFSMKYVEDAGLVKFDFLGLKTLTVLAEAEKLIRRTEPKFDIARIPLDDKASYDMLGRAETVGVFQLESTGMKQAVRDLKPDVLEDIIALVALYRPGPMANIPAFINRKHGREQPDYLHPSLEGILKETYGVMIYQEQVMQIAQVLSGYSLGGADLLRRAMGKKIKSEMDAQKATFIKGAVDRGVPAAQAEMIFDQVEKFAGYGFNKSHAAAYALVAYQTAYLKANHPVAFFAASMTLDLGNTDKLNVFRQELSRLGIKLLPPDINKSEAVFSVEEQKEGGFAIRYALAALKGVGRAAMEGLVAERRAKGPFKSLADFAGRVDPKQANKRIIESLAAAGAFDSLLPNRRQVSEAAETVLRHAAAAMESRTSQQVSLFGDSGGEAPRIQLPQVPDWSPLERLQHEFDAVGFYLSAHPLDGYQQSLARIGAVKQSDLARLAAMQPGRQKVAGIVLSKRERTAKNGSRFAFVELSDQSGVFEVVVFSELLARTRELLEAGKPLLAAVDARPDGDGYRLMAQSFDALEEAAAQAARGLKIFASSGEVLPRLKAILAQEQRGKGRVAIVLDLENNEELEFELAETYRLAPATRQAIKGLAGLTVQDL